jgi:hypothetical protein
MKYYCKESMTTQTLDNQIFKIEKGKLYNFDRGILDNIIHIIDNNNVTEVFSSEKKYRYLLIGDYFYTKEELRKLKLESL